MIARLLLPIVAAGALTASGCATVSTTTSSTTDASTDASTAAAMSEGIPYRRPAPPAVDVTPAPLVFDDDGAFAWVDGRTGAALTFADVAARVGAHRFVMVGEQHDQLAHHEAQRRVLEVALKGGTGVVVGLEMLTWDKQPELDRFNSGDSDVDAFATAVDWKKAWGFDFALYAPIFMVGHDGGARFLALNAPRTLVRALREKGLDGIADADRVRVPELDLGDPLHRRWFEGIFSTAGHPLKPADLDGFYRAQVVWDEAMADGAARAARAGARQVVVIAGAGHVAHGRGVPQRIERRMPGENVLTIVPLKASADDVVDVVKRAIAVGEADVLVVPRFDVELAL